jgi:peptide/nickel transport system permease protein
MLPSFVLGWAVLGLISRLVRASMLEVLGQDYVRTARAKGLLERDVFLRHALKNALIPTLTVVGLSMAFLLSGAVLTEQIFGWPGIGRYTVQAAQTLDYPAIQSVAIFAGVLMVLSNLLTDITYAIVDPRIRLS